jgi:hypothetical protein
MFKIYLYYINSLDVVIVGTLSHVTGLRFAVAAVEDENQSARRPTGSGDDEA